MDQVCPEIDLAVVAVGQNFSGEIATTPEVNGFNQNRVITNPKPLSFTVKYENK